MSSISEAWERIRLAYQIRYARLAKKIYAGGAHDLDIGAFNEQSYVLINIFGLTQKQVEELEKDDFRGLTDKDLFYR